MNSLTDSPLTVAQLETAAADLRNAALVVEHAGHGQGRLVSQVTGQVCALGAIELATFKKLICDEYGFEGQNSRPRDDAGWYRGENAVKVFADFVPSALCTMCDDEAIERHSATCTADKVCIQPREPHDKVAHYNDAHCVSPDLLMNLLGLAADRALDAVYERRTLLTGDRLTAPVLV